MSQVQDLLREAAMGRAGVDRRFIRSILDSGPGAAAEVLAFSEMAAGDQGGEHRLLLDDLLVDLFRHWGTPEALDYFIATIRRFPEEVNDDLVEALLPLGERAVEPLLKLYEDLGEEEGSDIAFLLAGLRVHDPRVLALLLDRLEFDAADGAFCLGLYGDQAARPALERVLAEIPEEEKEEDKEGGAAASAEALSSEGPSSEDGSAEEKSTVELRREIRHALDSLDAQIDAPQPVYTPEPFDIFAQYPERALPEFDVLTEQERVDLLASPDADVRAGSAASLFNGEVSPKARRALLEIAKSDPDAKVRGHAWAAIADATEDEAIRRAMLAVLNDTSRPLEERGGSAVGLYAVADRDDVREALETLYAEGGAPGQSLARARALEAMWRSLWKPYAKYFPENLDHADAEVVRQALRGSGYFQLTPQASKIASYIDWKGDGKEDSKADRTGDFESLRDDALFAYALAMPGETTRGRIRGLFRKIDAIADLTTQEAELVEFALDERLKLRGLAPVFAAEDEEIEDAPPAPEPAAPFKAGRNDPCPCGSGKKFKKCHGQ
jgi:hypothetical protein